MQNVPECLKFFFFSTFSCKYGTKYLLRKTQNDTIKKAENMLYVITSMRNVHARYDNKRCFDNRLAHKMESLLILSLYSI